MTLRIETRRIIRKVIELKEVLESLIGLERLIKKLSLAMIALWKKWWKGAPKNELSG